MIMVLVKIKFKEFLKHQSLFVKMCCLLFHAQGRKLKMHVPCMSEVDLWATVFCLKHVAMAINKSWDEYQYILHTYTS